jgi:thiosulfate/3-mercaptopyruvate sulfurtransferase
MLKFVPSCALAVLAVCLPGARPVIAQEGIAGNLVTTRWLQKNLTSAEMVVLDASFGPAYAAKHIPGAINVDFLTYGFPERPPADMEARYQAWGISPGKKVVMYDQGGTFMATRLFFSLYYHGFPAEDLFILDGGLAKWQEQGFPVTTDVTPPPKKGTFRILKINEDVRVRLPEFLTASGSLATDALVEALGPDWHFGEVLAFNKAGHIPNAVMLPSADFFNPDKTFKSPDEIRKMAAYVGLTPEKRIHTHCGGGVAASVPFFALKFIANYPRVTLYAESQMGWLSDERDLPYWTYDAPFLIRGTGWLQSWGGQRMRAYGASNVSVVDVRTAAEFNEGHVPFAVNIPSDVFRSRLADPGKLASFLGAAGINPVHEAVVISGAGLTPESALAFAMLEKLGQKKVSVFMDSMDQWVKLGFSLTREPTIVGPRKGPQDLAVAPSTYPESPRQDVIIADPSRTHGVYPKVLVASGVSAPAKAPAGTVVHVPYTELLNADGTPKAAKDIWKILAKAGVPRYAELVCFSDNPGEAAVNYFVLKLMGYPDVKIWVAASAAQPTL